MNTKGHFITAKVLVNPQWSVEEGKIAIEKYCQEMQQEPGCHQALALQDNIQPRCFMLWEHYESQVAHQQHFTQPHTHAFIKTGWVSLIEVIETTR